MALNPLIVAMGVATAAVIAIGYVLLWMSTRKFDRKYGHTYDRPPGG